MSNLHFWSVILEKCQICVFLLESAIFLLIMYKALKTFQKPSVSDFMSTVESLLDKLINTFNEEKHVTHSLYFVGEDNFGESGIGKEADFRILYYQKKNIQDGLLQFVSNLPKDIIIHDIVTGFGSVYMRCNLDNKLYVYGRNFNGELGVIDGIIGYLFSHWFELNDFNQIPLDIFKFDETIYWNL